MDFKLIYLAKRNSSIRPEDWPRTWRSHAIFASQFPSVGPSFNLVLYCSRVLNPSVDGQAQDPYEATQEYDGAAVISCGSAESLRAKMDPEVREKIAEDERRVFSTQVDRFSFRCKEALVWGSAPTEAVVIRFLVRKAGTTRNGFLAHWGARHADIARRAAEISGSVRRYVHNRLIEEPPPGYPFDGISEIWFDSAEEAARSFTDGTLAPIAQDLPGFCDMDRSVTLIASVTHRWPRA